MKIQTIFVIIISLIPLINGLFERRDQVINLRAGASRKIKSLSYREWSRDSTRVTIRGQVGQRLSVSCKIKFSRQRGRCSNDYFYIGYDRHPRIKGAKYYCGKRTVNAKSKRTTGRPVLVIATSQTIYGTKGKYDCDVRSVAANRIPSTTHRPTTTRPTPVGPDPGELEPEEPEDPNAEDPNGEDPNGEDPDAEDPNGEDPNGEDPDAEDPNGQDPNGQDPNGQDPNGQDPNGQDPNGQDPNGQDPNGQDPNGQDPNGQDP